MGEIAIQQWGTKGLPSGQPFATWYDRYGRSFFLPSDPYSIEHYQARGLRLHPPESPEPVPEDDDWSEGSANATRGGPRLAESSEESEAFGGLPFAKPKRKRGPDKKPRKRRKKARNRA